MNKQRNFEVQKGYAIFRPTGQVSIGRAVELVTEGIAFARSLDVWKLLIDITNLEGFEPPGVVLRYFLIHEWARAAGRSVCVALVTGPEMVDVAVDITPEADSNNRDVKSKAGREPGFRVVATWKLFDSAPIEAFDTV
jgi:hypothetical protein